MLPHNVSVVSIKLRQHEISHDFSSISVSELLKLQKIYWLLILLSGKDITYTFALFCFICSYIW